MKMNKPYIEIVRFDAEDVIATSGVINCTVNPLAQGDRVLHYNHKDKNYFVYDVTANSNTSVDKLNGNTKLHHNGMDTQYSRDIEYTGHSDTGYSAYIYKDNDWTWWDEYNDGSHGNY